MRQRRRETVSDENLTEDPSITVKWASALGGGTRGEVEGSADLAGEVALGASADPAVGVSLGASVLDVGAGFGVAGHADHHGYVQGAVEASVATAVESVTAGVA